MADYQKFFDDVTAIVAKQVAEQRYFFEKGNAFNLFDVLSLNESELVHSAFISCLLNPNGIHGKKYLFLKMFLERFEKTLPMDCNTAKVYTEYVIGPISEDGKRGGRIDILVTDAKNNALIIENKINALDQKYQLVRYANFGKDKGFNYKIVYLTLDGKDASIVSTGKCHIKYTKMSYKDGILPWMEDCLKSCDEDSLLYKNISQYIEILKDHFSIMDKKYEKQLVELATASPDNTKAFISLMANQTAISKTIIDSFVSRLKDKATSMGYIVNVGDGFAVDADTYISFTIPEADGKWAVWIGSDKNNGSNTFFDISAFSEHKPHLLASDLKEIPSLWNNYDASKDRPSGWDFLWSESGKKNSGTWYNFYSAQALTAMVDGSMEDFIVKHIFKPVLENKILQYLSSK